MQRALTSWWLVSGVSALVGTGLGLLLAASRVQQQKDGHTDGLLCRIPFVPINSVEATASDRTVPGILYNYFLPRSAGCQGGVAVAKYGFPSLANVKTRESYVTSYDPRTRTASWVMEQLNPSTITGPSNRNNCDFKEDDSVHEYHRSTNADYRGSGFDRGHLAAAGNHKWSQKATDDTFYLSNVSPQNPHMNQKTWNKLEQMCRSLTKDYRNVYVCTGPLYLPRQEPDGKLYVRYQVLGRNHVAVPTHFFKVLILERSDGVELRSYIMPNSPVDEKIPLERFLVPIETIERASGLLFVPNIMKRTKAPQAITAK